MDLKVRWVMRIMTAITLTRWLDSVQPMLWLEEANYEGQSCCEEGWQEGYLVGRCTNEERKP